MLDVFKHIFRQNSSELMLESVVRLLVVMVMCFFVVHRALQIWEICFIVERLDFLQAVSYCFFLVRTTNCNAEPAALIKLCCPMFIIADTLLSITPRKIVAVNKYWKITYN